MWRDAYRVKSGRDRRTTAPSRILPEFEERQGDVSFEIRVSKPAEKEGKEVEEGKGEMRVSLR